MRLHLILSTILVLATLGVLVCLGAAMCAGEDHPAPDAYIYEGGF